MFVMYNFLVWWAIFGQLTVLNWSSCKTEGPSWLIMTQGVLHSDELLIRSRHSLLSWNLKVHYCVYNSMSAGTILSQITSSQSFTRHKAVLSMKLAIHLHLVPTFSLYGISIHISTCFHEVEFEKRNHFYLLTYTQNEAGRYGGNELHLYLGRIQFKFFMCYYWLPWQIFLVVFFSLPRWMHG